jgi:hypothetical protein
LRCFLFVGAYATAALAASAVLAGASADLIDRLRADPFTLLPGSSIVRGPHAFCEAFADVTSPPIVRLHGDAHIEQFAADAKCVGPRRFR